MAVIDELLVGLGFDYDDKELKKFSSEIDRTTGIIKKLAAAATLAATAITGMVIATTAASDEQGKFADELGVTVEDVDALQFALTRAGGAAEGMSNSLRTLAARASESARGVGAGVEVFGILGLSATGVNGELKTTTQLLIEISSAFQGMNRAKQIEFADKLGIRDSIRLLQQGPKEINNLIATAKALGVTTAEDAAISADFQDSMTDLWRIIKQVSRTITRELAPTMNETIGVFTDWWIANRKLLEQNLPDFLRKLSIAMKLFIIATATWISFRLVLHVAQLVKLMSALKLQVLLTNAAVIILPALIFGAIAAIALLAEDAKRFFEGGDSFIGGMIEKFPKWSKEVKILAAVFAKIADLAIMTFEGWKLIFGLFSSGTFLSDLLLISNEFAKNLFGGIGDSIEGLGADFSDLVSKAKKFTELKFESLKDLFESLSDGIDLTPFVESFKNVFLDITDLFAVAARKMFLDFQRVFIDPIMSPILRIRKFFSKDTDDGSDSGITDISKVIVGAEGVSKIIPIGAVSPFPDTSIPGAINNKINTTQRVSNISVDSVNIIVQGVGSPEQTAQAVSDIFQQAAQDLTTTVDQ